MDVWDTRAAQAYGQTLNHAGGAPTARRPRFRLTAALLAVWYVCSACFTYVPAPQAPAPQAPAPGRDLSLELTDTGRVAHASALGPGILRVAGTLRAMEGDRYVIDVTSVQPLRGQELPVTGVRVTLAPSDVTGARVRTLSRRRTVLVVGAAVVTVVVFFVTKGFRAGSTPPDGSRSGGGPDQ